MAHSATLELEGISQEVRELHWSIVQVTDDHHQPLAGVLAGKIHLVFNGLLHPVLDEWMASDDRELSGEVRVRAADGQGVVRVLRFVDAICVNEGLHFTTLGGVSSTTSVLISARVLIVNGALEINNNW